MYAEYTMRRHAGGLMHDPVPNTVSEDPRIEL